MSCHVEEQLSSESSTLVEDSERLDTTKRIVVYVVVMVVACAIQSVVTNTLPKKYLQTPAFHALASGLCMMVLFPLISACEPSELPRRIAKIYGFAMAAAWYLGYVGFYWIEQHSQPHAFVHDNAVFFMLVPLLPLVIAHAIHRRSWRRANRA